MYDDDTVAVLGMWEVVSCQDPFWIIGVPTLLWGGSLRLNLDLVRP